MSKQEHQTILVVDDDDSLRDSLIYLLEGSGYRVIGAADGKQGVRLLEEGLQPCLILLDLEMPRFDGVWFLAQQRNDPRFAKIPTVVMSAAEARRQLVGIATTLPKPIPVEDLFGIVEAHCPPTANGCP